MNINIAAIISFVISLAVTAVLGYFLIPVLHKLKFGQNILTDIGPSWHAKKQGTPTMGGIMFIIGIIFATAVALIVCKASGFDVFASLEVLRTQQMTRLFAGILMAFCFALVGFADDYIKVVKKRNLGLTEIQKTIPQVLIIGGYLASLVISESTSMYIPFYGKVAFDSIPGIIFFCLFGVCVTYGAINAVNFTDGIDGLCGSVTMTTAVTLAVIAALKGLFGFSMAAAALAGAWLGFVLWNKNPAKVFMGDTGSMFLGGMVVALSYAIGSPIILLLAGIVFVIEGASDVLQIVYYRVSGGKRIFKMAPIHHHFEMCGWKEEKIVLTFAAVSAIMCLIAWFGIPKPFI